MSTALPCSICTCTTAPQADVNWYNPTVRDELFKVVNFWYEKGVRGFRFDVINVIGKDEELLDAPEGTVDKAQYTDTPIVHTASAAEPRLVRSV